MRERFISSNIITVKCGVPRIAIPPHARASLISVEITKMSRYFDSLGLVFFDFYLFFPI